MAGKCVVVGNLGGVGDIYHLPVHFLPTLAPDCVFYSTLTLAQCARVSVEASKSVRVLLPVATLRGASINRSPSSRHTLCAHVVCAFKRLLYCLHSIDLT